ncbi:sensor histidine kinase [Sphingomonas sp.]|uniref:sensor histidine kinase n=1 Tax=Sphingomonas sp. TaxID=28214 RepID=UPI001ED029C4|nr:sensor histidine kinase [Sphingomonas sp.]MBX3594315.1 histidine kinase [Sphingomonas sp.]
MSRVTGLPTGAKVLLILSAGLLPLALVAFFASVQTNRIADQEVRARLRIAISESARSLRGELAWELRELRGALPVTRDGVPNCGRLAGIFEPQASAGLRYSIVDPDRRLLCGVPLRQATGARLAPGQTIVRVIPGAGLQIEAAGTTGHVARAFFPVSFLTSAAEPSATLRDHGILLVGDGGSLALRELKHDRVIERHESQTVDLDVYGLKLEMSVASAPITSSLVIAAISPFLMWLLAVAIAWFVVDRLLIRPLRRLRRTVGAYQPGELIDPVSGHDIAAQEIRDLGDTFRELSSTVQLHERELAEGLSRQTKLTREVHHRVKNNLQVIASLINLHARSANGPDALAAYASIQRRVDALAVVQRNHYAGFEETRGIELRPVIGELASNIRATAADGAQIGIILDLEPVLVSQDSAVAIAFLVTEMIELAISVSPAAQINVSVKEVAAEPGQAILRISSPALIEGEAFSRLSETRYGRVIGGLVRQLRTRLHHAPLVGAFEVPIAISGRT